MSIIKGFGIGSPHANSMKLKENKQKEMREHMEKAVVDVHTQTHMCSGNIQKTIEQIRRLDRIEPVDQAARRRACRTLKMYMGQYRMMQVMCAHVDTLYSEIEMREITQEFAQAISETAEMLHGFDRYDITMPKVFENIRKIIEPLHSEERLRKYDELYKRLAEMYPSESQSTDSISDEWLEGVVAGRISWDAVPEMNAQNVQNVQPQPAQESAKAQTVSKAEDFHSMMDSLSSSLKGED